ncbi:DNA polymerase III subunit beta [Halobacillus sp. Nhm2S1]|uniref:DNA polymerase III subunit beta n=1 Tax=Halobacillus sp. Nhm2S1 TaxID=2866716 RepID=UPI001C7379AF|nr:DNA polymerase III subunit beta [Halobacillus sp. Nhm2S1]MBX0356940.1 DNA polymerase III subunit beta [Halobacillus sp. Nhm2S1]
MELRIHKHTLEEAVSETASVLGRKSLLPVLNGIRMEVTERELILVGYDGELMIKKVVPVHKGGFESLEPGACILPADFFQGLVKKMPGPVHMKKVNDRMMIESGEVKTSLSVLSTEEDLHLPEVHSDGSISISSIDLVELVRQTLFAAAEEGSRPVLTGIHIEFSGNHVQALATDSHRLAFVKKKLNSGKKHSCTVPMKTLRELVKLFKNRKDCLEVSITDQLFKIESSEVTLTSKLIDGAFPDMAAFLSKSSKAELVIDKNRLMYSVDRAGLFAKDSRNHQIKLRSTKEKTLNISSFSPQVGMIEENIPLIKASGEDLMDVWIDSVFLLEALKATKGEDIQIFYNGTMSPLILRSKGNDEQVHVISPVRA